MNLCCCVGCKTIKGAAVPDKLLYGAAGGLSLRHRDYRCTGFPFLIAGDVYCLLIASAFADFWGAVFPPLGDAVFSPAYVLLSLTALSQKQFHHKI